MSDYSPLTWKFVSEPCGSTCDFCNGPIEKCDGKCLAACKAKAFGERFDGVLFIPEPSK